MPKLLPKWLMRRYLLLWKHFGNEKFTFENAQKVLDEDARIVNLFLSEIKRFGWLIVEVHPDDPRKRLYQLRPMEKVFGEITKEISDAQKVFSKAK